MDARSGCPKWKPALDQLEEHLLVVACSNQRAPGWLPAVRTCKCPQQECDTKAMSIAGVQMSRYRSATLRVQPECGTAQRQHVQSPTREMCNLFFLCSLAVSALARCSVFLNALKKLATWVVAMAPRSLTFVLGHPQCTQCACRHIPHSILKSDPWISDRWIQGPEG